MDTLIVSLLNGVIYGLLLFMVSAGLTLIFGMMGVLIRRNLIIIFMCVELMLTAANISLVAFGWENNSLSGQSFAIFTIAVAAAEAAVGLAIILALSRRVHSVNIEDMTALRD